MLAELVVALGKRDGRVHYRDTGRAGHLYNASRIGEHVRFFHDRSDSVMQPAALGREIVLVFDEYNGGGVRIKLQGILLIGGDAPAAMPTVEVRLASAHAQDKGPR
ncbi:hypothetical protein GCM10009825_24710 [Arthrobacter humicola]|uniref:Uncharacterized protein n=1 Tax=Arthrobacter humicola TaxID=409291 RepID=A0ABP5KZR6_9MICC